MNIMSYQIESKLNNHVMDIEGGCGKPKGTSIVNYPYHGGSNQQWSLVDAGVVVPASVFHIKSLCTNEFVLDVEARVVAQGTPIIGWPLHGGTNQQWFFKRLPEPNPDNWCNLVSVLNEDYCAEVQGSSNENLAKVVLGVLDLNNPDRQIWRYVY